MRASARAPAQALPVRSTDKAAKPPGEHVVVFDAGCAFCLSVVDLIRRKARPDITRLSFDELNRVELLNSPDESQILASAHYITPDGTEYHGGESITKVLQNVPRARFSLCWMFGGSGCSTNWHTRWSPATAHSSQDCYDQFLAARLPQRLTPAEKSWPSSAQLDSSRAGPGWTRCSGSRRPQYRG